MPDRLFSAPESKLLTFFFKTGNRSILLVSGTLTVIFLGNCTQDTFPTSLDQTPVSPYDTMTTQMRYFTYQVPPAVGNHPSLYIGRLGDYESSITLLTLGDIPALGDSLSVMDSAYAEFTVDTAKTGPPLEGIRFVLGYVDLDSNYSESGSNYTNVDWLPAPASFSLSVLSEDTASGLPIYRFPLDTSWVNAWSDTANPRPLLVLERESPGDSTLTALFSTEATAHRPFLRLFAHSDTVSIDTTVNFTSDLSIIVPPKLEAEAFDSLRVYAGAGAGLRSVILPGLDSLNLPSSAVIAQAHLILRMDTSASLVFFDDPLEIQLGVVTDTIDSWLWGQTHDTDPYPDQLADQESVAGGRVTFSVKNVIQAAVSDIRDFYGFKISGTSSNYLFNYASFHVVDDDSSAPVLEILYVAP